MLKCIFFFRNGKLVVCGEMVDIAVTGMWCDGIEFTQLGNLNGWMVFTER